MVVEPYVSKIIDSEEARPASSIDLGALETHAEALQSRSIVLETMESLDLYDDPEFAMEATPLAKLKEKLLRLSHVAVERIPPAWHASLGLSTADAETAWAVERAEEGSAVPADDFDAREVAALIFAGHLAATYSDGSYVRRSEGRRVGKGGVNTCR